MLDVAILILHRCTGISRFKKTKIKVYNNNTVLVSSYITLDAHTEASLHESRQGETSTQRDKQLRLQQSGEKGIKL